MGAMEKPSKIKMLEMGAAGLAGLVVLRLALKPVLLPFGFHFSLSWLLIPVRLLLRLAFWLTWRLTKLALLTIVCNNVWKAAKLLWNIVMSDDNSSDVPHDCIPPPGWRHQEVVQAETVALIKQSHPELLDLAASGALIAIEPRKLLVRALQQQQQQGGEGGQLLQGSELLDACLAAAVPELVFVIGTAHVSQQSAEDVKRTVKAIRPQLVVLELCAPRLKALLVDPFADPLHDLEPCPERLAAAEASRHKTLASVLKAALASRDHNVLSTIMSGLYGLLAEKLQAQVGIDFLAARHAMIELALEQEQGRSRRTSSPSTLLSLLRGDSKRGSSGTGSSAAQPAAEADQRSCSWSSSLSSAAGDDPGAAAAAAGSDATQPVTFTAETVSEQRLLMEQVGGGGATNWLQRCVAADRPVMDTLQGMWGALKPLRRLAFMWDLLGGLGDVDAELIESLGSEDVVELLMKELGAEFPELLKPLLHDRNWLLATTAWRAAQWSAQPGQPVLAVVGRGHLGGIVYVMQRLVQHVAALSLRAAAEEEEAAAAAKAEAEAAASAPVIFEAQPEAGLAVAAEQGTSNVAPIIDL